MLQWNNLEVTSDDKHLIVDVQVIDDTNYDNIEVDSVLVQPVKSLSDFDVTGPKSTALKQDYAGNSTENFDATSKYQHIVYDVDTFQGYLFFVYAYARGTYADGTPCNMKSYTLLGVVYNKYPIYKKAVKLLDNMDNCTPDDELIDWILRWKMFNLALECGDYTRAIEIWNEQTTDITYDECGNEISSASSTGNRSTSNCNCHG